MSFDSEPSNERGSSGGKPTIPAGRLTFAKAIELGEYDPDFLATFPEWGTFTRHVQFEYIKQALDNRYKQLIRQWAEINNFLDFSQKPHLKAALENIQKQLKVLQSDRERLFVEYSA